MFKSIEKEGRCEFWSTRIHPPCSSPRILVVEDHSELAASLEAVFAVERFEVRVAYDGRHALDILDQWRPHVAVLDLTLPDISGIEVGRLTSERLGPACPLLLAHSALEVASVRHAAKAAGFTGFVGKPGPPTRLLGAIRLLIPLSTSAVISSKGEYQSDSDKYG